MKTKILFLSLVLISKLAAAQAVFIADKGEVTFYSYAPIEDIKATCTQVNSMYNTSTGEIAFMIPMRGFKFAKSLMQEHFNEKYIESDKYPHATYKGTVNEKIDPTKSGKYNVSSKGIITVHGKEKEISTTGEMEIENDQITLNTRFFVALDDFNIKKPQLLLNNIADTIEVKMKAIYKPYVKK
jgi:hypothetical protein